MIPDWLRLALGTLTIARVPPPRVVDQSVARGATLAAPVIGALLCLPSVALLWILVTLQVSAPLIGALTIALIAVLTRGLHLDGLADTADGLGSGARNERALDIMSKSDIGPFGVLTLVLVLVIQVTSTASILWTAEGVGLAISALVTALVSSRAALTMSCRRGVPAARPTGLGAAVAECVSPMGAAGVLVLTVSGCTLVGWLIGGLSVALVQLLAALAALSAAASITRRCVGRFGGITGDVLGCGVETAMTASLLTSALLAHVALSALTA